MFPIKIEFGLHLASLGTTLEIASRRDAGPLQYLINTTRTVRHMTLRVKEFEVNLLTLMETKNGVLGVIGWDRKHFGVKGRKYHIYMLSRRDVFSLALSASHIWILGLIFCHKIFTYKDTFQVEYRASSLNRLSSRSTDAEKMSRRDNSIVLKYHPWCLQKSIQKVFGLNQI